jgi:hypothetical protein
VIGELRFEVRMPDLPSERDISGLERRRAELFGLIPRSAISGGAR